MCGDTVIARRFLAAVIGSLCVGAVPGGLAQGNDPSLATPLSPQTAAPATELKPAPELLVNPVETSRLESFEQEIARIEMEQGAWGVGLSEQLAGLGESYQQRGRHREAIEIFDRAIHVSRINNGLYDLNQVPLVENLVESLIARGEWEQVHDRNSYLYWLHKRNYGEQDPRMLPVIDKLGRWFINDYALNVNARSTNQLMSAHSLFENATNIISKTYGDSDLRLVDPLRGLVLSNWFFATYTGNSTSQLDKELLSRSIGPEIDADRFAPNIHGNINYYGGSGVIYPDDDRSPQLARHISSSYVNGKNAISKMVEIYSTNPDAPPGAAAGAKVELGDWYMLFDRWQSAAALYKEAYDALAADDKAAGDLDKLFGRPVALPDLDLMEVESDELIANAGKLDETLDYELDGANYVLVSFDITRFGEVTNINILDSKPEDAVGKRARVKRSLEKSRYRPRFSNGEPVATLGLVQRFVFSD